MLRKAYIESPSVTKPPSMDFSSIRTCLKTIVPLCLDSDPSLMPLSCLSPNQRHAMYGSTSDEGQDVDDFRFWSEEQARRICVVMEQSFGVECTPEVVVAEANLTALAGRVLVSREILEE